MTERSVNCPFCAAEVPMAASVCRSCRANKGVRSGLAVPFPIAGAAWLFWGPLICWFAFFESSPGSVPSGYGALLLAVTGVFVLRWMWQRMTQSV